MRRPWEEGPKLVGPYGCWVKSFCPYGLPVKNGQVPAAPRVLARIGSTAEWKAGSSAAWPSRGMSGRRSSQAATAEIWDMDISNSLRMILFFFGGRVYTIMGQPRSTTSCNVKPTPSLQASERSESRASLHSGNVAWTKIQLVAGYYMSFGGKTQVGYPPATHTKKNNSHPLSTRYSCYLALSMGD